MTDFTPAFDLWLHNVKNQLTVILGFSEILLEEATSDDARQSDLREIHAAAQRVMVAIARPPWRAEEGGR